MKMAIKSEMIMNHIDYQGLIDDAVEFTGLKTGDLKYNEVIEKLRAADVVALGYFRYGVAKKLLENLRTIDPQLARGYLIGEHDYLEKINRNPITIVIKVAHKTAAHKSLLSGVERGLLAGYKKMMGIAASEQESFVDIEIIDEDDLTTRYNYLHSIFAPTLKIDAKTN